MSAATDEQQAPRAFWKAGAAPLIAVIRAARSSGAVLAGVETIVEAGVTSIELTLTTAAALDMLAPLRERLGTDAVIGVGTVWSADDASAAIDAGADYLVTPGVVPGALAVAAERRVPLLAGAFTPTEVKQSMSGGATAIKLFPACDGRSSIDHMKSLNGPLPGLRVVPSGGVPVGDIRAWLAAGAFGVSLGSDLVRDGLGDGGRAGLRTRTMEAVAMARSLE